MSTEEISSRRWMYIAFFLALVLLANTAALFYVGTPLSGAGNSGLLNRVRNLENQVKTFNQSDSRIKALEEQIKSLNLQIQNLQTINNTGSGSLLLSALYNITRDSVVLIENRIMSGGTLVPQSLGSGFVYRSDGYIATNNHVVEGADELVVTFFDGNVSKATIAGTDPYSDLAILKLSRSMPWLKALPLGSSLALKVGETVVALGSPFGLSSTMTSGIVSHTGRDLDAPGNYRIVDVIQHDVSINPGNSGGPLINLLGQVVGINTAIASGITGTSSGVGFAIPSDTIAREAFALIEKGTYQHPYLGVRGLDANLDIADAAKLNVTWGFLVTEVSANGPCDKAGIKGGNVDRIVLGQTVRIGGDLIVGIDGRRVRQLDDISVYTERNKRPGDQVTFTIIRGGQKLLKIVTLGIRPPS